MNNALYRLVAFNLLAMTLLASCGGGGGGSSPVLVSAPPASEDQWIKIETVTVRPNSEAEITGTAWVSDSWVGHRCSGIGCFLDGGTSDYPGVDVTYVNQTNGDSGTATSYYGGGTNWEHHWSATVPLSVGNNIIQISAYDPDGKGSSITVTAVAVPDTEAPSVPSNPTATALSKTEILLTWSASTDNNAFSGYKIYRGGVFLATSADASFTDTLLTQDTKYCYSLSAYDASGNESAKSSEACATTMVTDYIIDSAADGACYNSSMAIDSADKLHLAYINRTGDTSYELRYATNASGAWNIADVDPSWGYPSIAVDSSNKAHIATHAKYLSNASGTWVSEVYDNNGVVPSIAVDHSGKAHIIYLTDIIDPIKGLLYRQVNYATNASGRWTSKSLMSTFAIPYSALALDSSAKSHVAIVNPDYSTLYDLSNVTGVWLSTDLNISPQWDGSCGSTPSTIVDSSDNVHIAVGNIYATNASGGWKTEIYDSSGGCPGIAVDSSAAPHIVYKAYDETTASYRLKHAIRGIKGWSSTTLSVIKSLGQNVSVAVDSSGVIHISYCDGNDIVYLKK